MNLVAHVKKVISEYENGVKLYVKSKGKIGKRLYTSRRMQEKMGKLSRIHKKAEGEDKRHSNLTEDGELPDSATDVLRDLLRAYHEAKTLGLALTSEYPDEKIGYSRYKIIPEINDIPCRPNCIQYCTSDVYEDLTRYILSNDLTAATMPCFLELCERAWKRSNQNWSTFSQGLMITIDTRYQPKLDKASYTELGNLYAHMKQNLSAIRE